MSGRGGARNERSEVKVAVRTPPTRRYRAPSGPRTAVVGTARKAAEAPAGGAVPSHPPSPGPGGTNAHNGTQGPRRAGGAPAASYNPSRARSPPPPAARSSVATEAAPSVTVS
ncbi:hypothetical protein GCM10019017_65570 [Streptomyces showdoensis]